MQHILVTGVNGFVGKHLARELKRQGHYILGTGQKPSLGHELADVVDKYIGDCDLTNPTSVASLPFKTIDTVINLAGLAQVGASFSQAKEYLRINVAVHTNLVEEVQKNGKATTRIIAVSTGAVYDSDQAMPLPETGRLIQQGSPYALSKVAMEESMRGYQAQGVDVIVARPFNHIGPGQETGFLVPDLAQQILRGGTVTVGNLTTERDYTDVRDVVKAYVLLATQARLQHNLYNVCSGHSISGQRILDVLLEKTDRQDATITVDQSRIRPTDPAKIAGDNSRLSEDTGWQPSFELDQTITDYLASAPKS